MGGGFCLSCWRYLGWSWIICARWETEESDKTRPDGRQNRQASASETSWCKRTANRAEPGVKRVSILKTPVLVSSFAAPLISTCKLSWSFRLLDIATSGVSIHSFLLHSTQTQHKLSESLSSCLSLSLPPTPNLRQRPVPAWGSAARVWPSGSGQAPLLYAPLRSLPSPAYHAKSASSISIISLRYYRHCRSP
jgi:hypothetical protein